MNILVVGKIHEDALTLLHTLGEVENVSENEFPSSTHSNQHEIIVIRTFTQLRKKEIEKFPLLKYVVSCSVGIDNIDSEELISKDIQLIHVPGTNANSVAEHTLYLILALLRTGKPPFFELNGKVVGIIGFGAIGKLVAQKLRGFGARLLAYDVITQDPQLLKEMSVKMVSLNEIAECSNIVSVHVPLMDQTRALISEDFFNRLKKGSFFVNTSREEIINENSLLKYLSNQTIRGVALDVYSDDFKNKIQKYNVLLTPHCAAQGEDSFRAMCLAPIQKLAEKL